ncbi:restriction endonuclease subunit S [Neisseria sicca]|uniref:restriction endonuclease subunit S n=1 Tax=Neisseria sicca TaxID=490 RepID=UPI0002E4C5DE|nr:restriction endonuclease subunit S [Neisseria sicca]
MNRYDRYKDSGIPWLGEVPEHWEIKHSNQIFKIHNGATPKTSEPDYWGDEIAWFTPKDLGDNKNKEIAASLKMITKEGYENCGVSLAPAKSIALSKRAPIGHLAITLLPAVVNQGCFLLEVLSPNDVNYLYYWLYANKSTLNSFGQGSTFMELPREKFAMLKISIPSEKEQTAIAQYLDTKLGEIDALIGKQQTLLEKLAEQRTAVITHAVTKGLNPAAPMKNSGVEWLGDVPAHWEVLSIKRLSQVKRGASPRPIDNPDYFDDDGEYAWVRIADVTASNMYLLETTQRLSDLGKSFSVPLLPNSLFLSIAGSVGKPIITKIKACIHDGFVYFPEYKNNIKFLYYIFYSGQPYLGLGKMGTQLNLNTDTVGTIKISLPPKEEQTAITDYLDQETAKIDRLCDTVNQTIGRLKEYRTALITQAVTGKIKITDE